MKSMNISSKEFDELMDTIQELYIGCTRVFAQKRMNDEQEKDFSPPPFPSF